MAANYYPVIFRAVSKLPANTREGRMELYGRARAALAAQSLPKRETKRELRALEWAIRHVEKSPKEIPGARGSTVLLVLTIFFFRTPWIVDPTSTSLYWVVRPWYRPFMK
jgi:hypothetical protein